MRLPNLYKCAKIYVHASYGSRYIALPILQAKIPYENFWEIPAFEPKLSSQLFPNGRNSIYQETFCNFNNLI
jgi:hypothetical protein